MRQHSGTSVSELKRKYNHLVPSNERVLGLAESENTMSLSEVRQTTNTCTVVHKRIERNHEHKEKSEREREREKKEKDNERETLQDGRIGAEGQSSFSRIIQNTGSGIRHLVHYLTNHECGFLLFVCGMQTKMFARVMSQT